MRISPLWLAALLPLSLAACRTPQRVSAEDGVACEAKGYQIGTDAYVDCALKRKAARKEGGEAPAAAPVPVSQARQVCDPTQATRTPAGRYVTYQNVVYDKETRLTWQRCSVGQTWKNGAGCTGAPYLLTWDDAKTGTAKGWRLPTEDELLTLASPTCKFPSINTDVFPSMDPKGMWYWSITPNGALQVWGVDFRDGRSSSAASTDDIGAIRLVRSEE